MTIEKTGVSTSIRNSGWRAVGTARLLQDISPPAHLELEVLLSLKPEL
jgi:hypothetical protein